MGWVGLGHTKWIHGQLWGRSRIACCGWEMRLRVGGPECETPRLINTYALLSVADCFWSPLMPSLLHHRVLLKLRTAETLSWCRACRESLLRKLTNKAIESRRMTLCVFVSNVIANHSLAADGEQVVFTDTIRYDARCYFNVRSKADISQLNLPHGNDN